MINTSYSGYLKRCIVLFFVVLLCSCENQYSKFHESRVQEQKASELVIKKTEEFSLDSVNEFEHEVIVSPGKPIQGKILSNINNAKEKVWLNVYLLTYSPLSNALVDAHKRGVDVKVILEKSVYQFPKQNIAAFEYLKKSGVSIVWASEKKFNFNHAKYLITDDEVMISTGNFTKSSMEKNRDISVFTKNAEILSVLNKYFEADFNNVTIKEAYPELVISPIDSRDKIQKAIFDAKNTIDVFAESLSDDEMLTLLKQRKIDGVKVKICLSPSKNKTRTNLVSELEDAGIQFTESKGPHVHAKTIFFDERVLLVGSINYTKNSLERNREIAVFLKNSDFLPTYKSIYTTACQY